MAATVRSDLGASQCDLAELLESAERLTWRAPEVTLVLADRVARSLEGGPDLIQATHLLSAVLNRLGRPAEAVEKIVPALRLAESVHGSSEVAAQLRVELARSAVEVGEPAIGLGLAYSVLSDESVPESLRATALLPASSALAALRDLDAAQDVNAAADACFAEQSAQDPSTAVLLRAWLRAQRAVAHRRAGDLDAAEDDARAGLALLVSLPDQDRDAGEVDGWLALELVQVLLDRGLSTEATDEAEDFLHRPVRAGSAAPIGWLRIAIATRVHLPAGRHQTAMDLLTEAARGAERHRADEMLAGCLDGLSKVHEAQGEFAEALDSVRSARAAERRRLQAGESARALLVAHYAEYRKAGQSRHDVVDLARDLVPEPVLASPIPDTSLGAFARMSVETESVDAPLDWDPSEQTDLPAAGYAPTFESEPVDEADDRPAEAEPAASFEWNDLEPIPDLPQHPALDPSTSFDPDRGLATGGFSRSGGISRTGGVPRPSGSRHGGDGAVPVSQLISRVAGGPERLTEERGRYPGRHHTPRTLQPPLGSRDVLPNGIEPDETETDEYFPRPLAPEHDTDRTGVIDEIKDADPPPAPTPRPFDDWPLGQGDSRPRMGDLLAEAMVAFQHTGHTDPFPTVVSEDFGLGEPAIAEPEPGRRETSTDPIFVAIEAERAMSARQHRRSIGD